MNLADRISIALRTLFSRSVQVRDEYIDGVHVITTRKNSDAEPIKDELAQSFGYASRAPDGSEALVVSLGGKRSQSIVILAHNREFKFELNPGETSIYNQFGDHVHLKDNGEVHVKARTKVYAETPLFETSNDCLIGGNMTVMGNTQHVGTVQNMSTTQLMNTTTIESGTFICAAPSIFTAALGANGGIFAQGVNIDGTHRHGGGTNNDGSTNGVIS